MNSFQNHDTEPKPPGPVKHYRRPRRRPAHLRTKTGCLTCRTRKKKCDEANRPCGNCTRMQLSCHWPGNKRAGQDDVEYSTAAAGAHTRRSKLLQNTGLEVLKLNVANMDFSGTFESCSSWSSKEVATSTSEPVNAGLEDVQACIPTAPSVSSIYPNAITPDSVLLFDFLRAVFLPQLIRPTAQRALIDLFSNESLTMALRVPFFMHALLACCGAEIPVEGRHLQTHFQRLAEIHYAKAVARLRASLDADLVKDGTVVLRTVIMLCIYERSRQYLSRGVDAHLLGMAQLIKVRFQQSSQDMPRSATDMTIDRVILEAFIFHTSTSIPFQHQEARPVDIDFAFSLAEKRLEDESYTTIWDHSHSPILGVPPRLFACIREIALMHQGLPRNVDVSRCYELMETVSDLEVDMLGSHQLVMGDLSRRDLVYKDASIGPRLYTLASKLLLDRMIFLVLGNSTVTTPQLLDEAIDLVNQLQPWTDYYAEYYGWPLQVLGVCTSLPRHRNRLLRAVTAFWKATRNGTMGRLMRTLACWSDPLDRPFPLELEDSERMPRHQTFSH